jgi:hypothetical protein
MWKPGREGVYLQRIDTNESRKIIIKLIREQAESAGDMRQLDRFRKVVAMFLNIKNDGAEKYSLDFDPWSDINVIPDGSIDEKDINAITQLGIAFYQQSVINSESGVFLSRSYLDLVEVFDPAQPIQSVAPLRHVVRIEVLDLEDSEEPELDSSFNAESFDEGASFAVRQNYAYAYNFEETPGLEDLVKAFFKLKL